MRLVDTLSQLLHFVDGNAQLFFAFFVRQVAVSFKELLEVGADITCVGQQTINLVHEKAERLQTAVIQREGVFVELIAGDQWIVYGKQLGEDSLFLRE